MSSLQLPTRFVQRSQLLPQGFPASLSGSETDVSTSNENLSNEERYVIRHTARQEPQGQENLSSNRSSLDVSSSSYNTLIIHGAGDEPWSGRLSGIRDLQDTGPTPPGYLIYTSGEANKMGSHSPSPGVSKEAANRLSFESSSSPNRLFDPNGREITDIPDDYLSQSQVLKHLAKEVQVMPSSPADETNRVSSNPPSNHSENTNLNYSENPSVSDQLKRRSLSHSGKDITLVYDLPNLPPPPQYLKWVDCPRLAPDKLVLSRSQPDLSRIDAARASGLRSVTSPRPKTNGREDLDSRGHEIWPPAEMVEILIQENSALKLELETCYQKVAKSQKLEQEIGKIHRAHEDMISSSERRERLERAARGRLQSDCRRLQEMNRALREQSDLLAGQLGSGRAGETGEGLRKEVTKRELLIAQLITQNKELVAAKERQEIELAAQRATLQEQRTHIDILDTALTNAQGNVVRLEEDCRKKQMYVDRVGQLQRALASLQLASDRREQTERKLRLQLERELRSERGMRGSGERGETAPELKCRLREREEKIMRLEGDVAKWEQRYLEESALRQAAIDAASIPKDAKIAALEKTGQETEKLIAEARSDKIRHMDEVHASQKRVTDLEARLKEQESKLAERDAMIRVLQKHTYDKDVSSTASSYLGRSPHPSLHTNSDLGTVMGSREEMDPVSTTSVFSTVSSVLTSSYTGSDSYTTLARAKYAANKSFDDTKKSLDDQLKELDSQLDSQLLSKRGLCCFPGFTNSSTAPRKGKISKPLLAGVGGGFEAGAGFLQGLVTPRYEQGRPEEMLLLEKQGRCSQQQRMQESCLGARIRSGSLPPTSLPRPQRTTRPPGAVKRAEYGRLSDGEGNIPPPRRLADFGKKVDARPPRRLGEYGRLSEPASRAGSSGDSARDSASEDMQLLPRARSLTRESSKGGDETKAILSSGKYRIQF